MDTKVLAVDPTTLQLAGAAPNLGTTSRHPFKQRKSWFSIHCQPARAALMISSPVAAVALALAHGQMIMNGMSALCGNTTVGPNPWLIENSAS
jgi:hypothetical protein